MPPLMPELKPEERVRNLLFSRGILHHSMSEAQKCRGVKEYMSASAVVDDTEHSTPLCPSRCRVCGIKACMGRKGHNPPCVCRTCSLESQPRTPNPPERPRSRTPPRRAAPAATLVLCPVPKKRAATTSLVLHPGPGPAPAPRVVLRPRPPYTPPPGAALEPAPEYKGSKRLQEAIEKRNLTMARRGEVPSGSSSSSSSASQSVEVSKYQRFDNPDRPDGSVGSVASDRPTGATGAMGPSLPTDPTDPKVSKHPARGAGDR